MVLNPSKLKQLAAAAEEATRVADLLRDEKIGKNPFVLKWIDVKDTVASPLDGELLEKWQNHKRDLAKQYFRLVNERIQELKRELKIK